ncbi:S1 RNA-binding domain-containing protein [Candidatus Woesearchaeota archaeon]|jgi:translation initiation factor 2 subunit 1|nr:S1 RNA-binding domain-containing protein [Candidatus Woesearchaeota archaeon]
MLRQKTGLPEDGEILLCNVTKIYPHCVFVTIDDFGGKSGMIHIGEVSPGRIRNIHDYVKEGKKVICKVLKTDKERGHVDLSLRRVTETQRRAKVDEIKQEQKAEKIIEFVAGELKLNVKDIYKTLCDKILNDYDNIYPCFEDYISDDSALDDYKLPENIMKLLGVTIKQRIKPSIKFASGEFKIKLFTPDGIETIKKVLTESLKKAKDSMIKYKGGGAYILEVSDTDYKSVEKKLKAVTEYVIEGIEKVDGYAEFKRIEQKS